MIFVIDGVDASGKTTLARCMADKLNCEYVHHTFEKHWSQRALFEHHLNFLDIYNEGEHLIIDRSWASCVIYGRIFRNNGNEINARLVERLLITLGCIQIFALPERMLWQNKFEQMCEEREEMYSNNLEKMCQVYEDYFYLCCGSDNNKSIDRLKDYGDFIADHGGMFTHRENCYAYDMYRHDIEAFADDKIKVHT